MGEVRGETLLMREVTLFHLTDTDRPPSNETLFENVPLGSPRILSEIMHVTLG